MDNYKEPAVLVTCRSRFGVDYSDVYEEGLILFRRHVFDSAKDGKLVTGEMLEAKINSKGFYRISDHDAVSLSCVAILQLVLLGFEARHDVPDWILRRYFDGHIREPARILRRVNQHTQDDVLVDLYRRLKEQDRVLKELMQNDSTREQMYNKINKFMKELQVGTMPQAKKGPIIVGQHYGLSDLSGLQNTQGFPQGGPTFPTQESTSFFEGARATPSYNHHTSSRYPYTHPATPNWKTPIPQPGNFLWSSQYGSTHNRDIGLVNLNLINQERREARPSIRNKGRNANDAPFNLGNAFVDDNEVDDEVLITGVRDNDDYTVYENVDPSKVYMPINAGWDYWVTGVINLPTSRFYMFDSLHSEV
ncbi:hypothetical protein Tco_0853809 [Tanacetum coccineum]